MSFVAAAVVTSAVVGYGAASNAANSAADSQTNAANQANATSMAQYNQTRADQEPWRQAGISALGDLKNQMPDINRSFSAADFQNDPGYAFRMAEGQKAIERSAAARGGSSGATMKSLVRFGQGTASDEYNNAYNRFNNDRTNRFNKLSSMAGLGQTANNVNAQAGMNNANNVSANQMAVGNANAANSIAQGNAINQTIGNGMNTWMNYQYMNKGPGTGIPSYQNPASGFQGSSYFGNDYQMGG